MSMVGPGTGVVKKESIPNIKSRRGQSYTLSTTLQKAFHIVECIAENQPIHAPDIIRLVGLTKGNVHSLLASLEYLGYIGKNQDGYALTFKMYAIGNTVPRTRDLATIARPLMEQLAEDEGINVYLTAPTNRKMVNIERVNPQTDIQVANDYAVMYDLHCTASGKLYLSTLTSEERQRMYSDMAFPAITDRTIVDPQKLEAEIAHIQECGYAVERTEHSLYINGIAAPITNHNREFLASLSVIGPTIILTNEMIDRLAPRVVADAQMISEEMGYL